MATRESDSAFAHDASAPKTPSASVENFYRGEAGARYFAAFSNIADINARLFAHKMRGLVAPSDRVFDYGTGPGANLAALGCAERGGYDVSEHARASARRNGVRVFDTTDEIPRGRWDVVTSHHVLEHVPAPIETLHVLRDLLA